MKKYRVKINNKVFDVVLEEVEEVKEIMITSMENIIKLNVPLDADLNVGKTWYEAK